MVKLNPVSYIYLCMRFKTQGVCVINPNSTVFDDLLKFIFITINIAYIV